jgi:ribosomal protein S18 acetylase RimI-like enzyme
MSFRGVSFRPISAGDLTEVLELWVATEGLTLRAVDSIPDLERFLERNDGLSWCAHREAALIGALLCGHDGRRGYIHHTAVVPRERGKGVGRELARRALAGLERVGISKCHLFVRRDNEAARRFWNHLNWELREDIWILSRVQSPDANGRVWTNE